MVPTMDNDAEGEHSFAVNHLVEPPSFAHLLRLTPQSDDRLFHATACALPITNGSQTEAFWLLCAYVN